MASFFFIYSYLALSGLRYSTWDLLSSVEVSEHLVAACGINSPTRDRTQAPRVGSAES